MNTNGLKLFATVATLCAMAVPSQAATIASEDFEAGAAGWSNDTTEDPGANSGGFSRHLGRFGAGGTSGKAFALSGDQTSVTIAFDFYRIDTWDGEGFFVDVSDTIGNSFTFATGPNFFFDGPQNFVYNFAQFTDRNSRLAFDFATTDTTLNVLFRSTLDQAAADEAWGVDNLLITDNAPGVGGVPEPGTWALLILGFGVTGAALRRARKHRATLAYA